MSILKRFIPHLSGDLPWEAILRKNHLVYTSKCVSVSTKVTDSGYVDCFSGPWQEKGDNLAGTSIALSLDVMRGCRDSLQRRFGKKIEFRALFVEKNKIAYKKLEQYLHQHSIPGVTTDSLCGDFYDLRKDILNWCGSSDFAFFFIDPKGWKNCLEISTLKPLIERPRSEFLINFMYDFLVRAHSQENFQNDMKAIFGEIPNTEKMTPKEREDHLISKYRTSLKSIRQTREDKLRSAYVSVLFTEKERTKYHLVYLTRHPQGIVKFMDASEIMNQEQVRVRATVKQERKVEKTGQPELGLFDDDHGHIIDTDGVDITVVKDYWLERLTTEPKSFGISELADMLEDTNWFQSDFQKAFKNMQIEGLVKNLDAKRLRTQKPVHFEKNEFLVRTM